MLINLKFVKYIYNSKNYFTNTIKAKQPSLISKKTFFEKIFTKQKLAVEIRKAVNEQKEFYEPPEALVFKNNRFSIIETDDTKTIELVQYCILYPIVLVSGYKLLSNILRVKIIGSAIWGAIFYYSYRSTHSFVQNKFFLIKRINLLEDGKTVEVATYADNFKADIADFRKVTNEEAMYYATIIGGVDYIPIVIRDAIYILKRKCKINDNEVFNAVCNGKYIKLTQEKKVDKENIIDI
jgi:hypothetical protein